ncbi:alpha/beta hydrolase [Kurthia massiliensis]|uniref:alpha/beta hydrolase n=1 Tax=Kurthia massiliensis TaxID=1033739 RepID=UPI000289CE37|nr:alpha/beta hydrolase [Kurthia massiliensis]
MTLHKGSIGYIEANKGVPYYEQAPEAVRAARARAPHYGVCVTGIQSIEDRQIDVRDAEINVRIYTPEGDGPFPVIMYYHGGGWVFGSPEYADGGCRYLTAASGAVVVSVDYRLAPEHPFPTPVNDAYDALVWVYEHAEQLNIDRQQITLSGDSAGGNLAAVVSALSADYDGPKISQQALIYPVVDTDFTTVSYDAYGENLGLDKEGMIWFADHYVSRADLKNPLVAPLQAKRFDHLPRTLLIAAQYDVLVDEGIRYVETLQQAGVHAERVEMAGLIHSYYSKIEFFDEETKQTAQLIADFIHQS